jgi:hypothetical protein
MVRARRAVLAFVAVVAAVPAVLSAEPVISVWYRGTPAGVPREDDLALIRAHGFTGVTWPSSQVTGLPELSRIADVHGLMVVLQPTASAAPLGGRVDVPVSRRRPSDLAAVVWRAIAQGAHIISFDPGQASGTGLGQPGRPAADWVAPAVALARQVTSNGVLFEQLRPGAAPRFLSSKPSGLEVALLEGPRCWVVIATNTGGGRARAVVQLQRAVPYAVWVSLIDGSTLGMLSEPSGPRWTIQLERGEAKAYVIDKTETGSFD